MNLHHISIITLGCLALAHPIAAAQDHTRDPVHAPKWTLSLGVAATNADVEVVDSDVTLPEDIDVGDFDIALQDTLSVSSTNVIAGVGYKILPMLEVSALAGLAWSDVDTGVTITGTPNGVLGSFLSSPLVIDADYESEASGYTLGLGANAFAPVGTVGSKTVVLTSSINYLWNRLEDGAVASEASKTTLGLMYPVSANRRDIIYRVAGGYNWLTRDVVRTANFGGDDIAIAVTQEFDAPWSVELGAVFPIAERFRLAVSAAQQLDGNTSAYAALVFAP